MSETPSTQPENAGARPDDEATTPFNDIERVILAGSNGEKENREVLASIVTAPLFFLTAQEVQDKSKIVEPLVLEGPDGAPILAIFTHPARVAPQFLEAAPYAVSISGGEAFRQADGVGIAINPGHPIGLVLDAANVKTIQGILAG